MLNIDLDPVRCAVRVRYIRLEGRHLVAHLVNDRHTRELQRAELAVERVDGIAVLVLGNT